MSDNQAISDNQEDSLIPVNITIADRSYRIKLAAKDEEAVRKTAALINQKMVEFKNAYAGKDMQDYISMVLLWFTTEQQQTGQNLYELEDIQNQIDALASSIEKAL
jgi:cell division protein ZapA (FtsZ GTPase activity inhibitor)